MSFRIAASKRTNSPRQNPHLFIAALLVLAIPHTIAVAQTKKSSTTDTEVERVAANIDKHLESYWAKHDLTATQRSSDAEYCRRVHLAIAGRIPHVSEVREFLNDKDPKKRKKLVKRLLESNGYIINFTTILRKTLIPEATTDIQARFLIPSFESWISRQLVGEKTRYDKFVEELLVTSLRQQGRSTVNPIAFYQAKENKPENLAAATSRMFLGVRLECAQCHEHPFDTWTQRQFWSYAAFFTQVRRGQASNLFSFIQDSFDRRQIQIPDTEIVVSAKLLNGVEPKRKDGQSARQALAEWVTSADNPYFAKATVNRMWKHFFGRGIVEPVDDLSPSNPASHPELLDYLAKELAAHDFDLKFLIRAMTASRGYQLSSRMTHDTQKDEAGFARMTPQPLTAEQLLRSLSISLGQPQLTRIGRNPQAAPNEFFEVFGGSSPTAVERSATILQALAMMNGTLISDATKVGKGETITAVAKAPWMNDEQRIETLFLATMSRFPKPAEQQKLLNYLEKAKNRDQALSDIYWSLLNSSEYLLNN